MEGITPRPVTIEEVIQGVRQVLTTGIRPARLVECQALLRLRTIDRLVPVDGDGYSRAFALESVLVDALARLGDGPFGKAARLLFGAMPDTRGRLLKDRRRLAAEQLDVLSSTFRKNYEDNIVLDLAVELWRVQR